MITHGQVWTAIDALAALHGYSPSGLARAAGLDATAFNPSKRVNPDNGREHWPTLSSVAKVLAVTDTTFVAFAEMVEQRAPEGGARSTIIDTRAGNEPKDETRS
jgi:phage repressor protein C with HTH and peptisase S24 domain